MSYAWLNVEIKGSKLTNTMLCKTASVS